MEIICLMGFSGYKVQSLIERFEQLGYHKLMIYTTQADIQNNSTIYNFIPKKYGDMLNDCDVLALWEQFGNHYVGIPQPVGRTKYVIAASPRIVKYLKNRFKGQVWGVLVNSKCNKDASTNDLDTIVNNLAQSGYIISPALLNNQNIKEAMQVADIIVDNYDDSQLELKIQLDIDRMKERGSL